MPIRIFTGCAVFFLAILWGPDAAGQQDTLPLWRTLPSIEAMPTADTSGLAAINGVRIYYAVFNQKGSDPVLLLHGGLSSSVYWSREVRLLSQNHEVIVMDNRGHGRSTLSDQPLTYQLMASDALALMDMLHLKKTSIVGWSDGGIMGMLLAIHHPERIEKLFTYGANYSKAGEKDSPPDTAASRRFMRQAEANYRAVSATPDSFPRLKKALFRMYQKEPEIDPADLRKISVPTTVACGQFEQFYTLDHFTELAHLIPRATLVVLPNVSHGGPVQDPQAFHTAVADLLDR